MKFEVGEVVKVREDLTNATVYSSEEGVQEVAVTEMVAHAGKLVRIKDIKGQFYLIENSERSWFWVDEMFEKFDPEARYDYDIKLVYVQFRDNEKKYIFRVPHGVFLDAGEEVFVDTIHGKAHATVAYDSFTLNYEVAKELLSDKFDLSKLKSVTGRAVQEKWVEKEF